MTGGRCWPWPPTTSRRDLWELPLQIREMAPDYRMYLRPHAGEAFETILYAMPPERLPGA